MTSPTHTADKLDGELRERLREAFGNGPGFVVHDEDRIIAWHRSELSRAGGERVEAIEAERAERHQWLTMARNLLGCPISDLVPLSSHEVAAQVGDKFSELNRQLAAVEAASWKANIASLRALEDNWDSYDGKKPKAAALDVAEFVHASPMSNGGIQIDFGADRSVEISPEGVLSCEGCEVLRDRLAAIEAARAKAMEAVATPNLDKCLRAGKLTVADWPVDAETWILEDEAKEAARKDIAEAIASQTAELADRRWNRRSDEAAERLRNLVELWTAWENAQLDNGSTAPKMRAFFAFEEEMHRLQCEVLPKAQTPEPDVMTQKRCGQGKDAPEDKRCDYLRKDGQCRTFRCTKCKRIYPWCQGANDDHPSWCDHCAVSEPASREPWIVSKPGVMGGKPCVRGTRITVETIRNVSQLWKRDEILREYPSLTPESLDAVLSNILRDDEAKAKRLPKAQKRGRKS